MFQPKFTEGTRPAFFDPSKYLCPHPSQNLIVSGDFHLDLFEFIQINYFGCSLEDQSQCLDIDSFRGNIDFF